MADLPDPSVEAAQHSAAVAARVAEQIRAAGGWISFAAYMDLVLYAPGLGYYSAGAAKFGEQGDFVTAPLLSPLFARTCAARIDAWLRASMTDTLLEFGPGTGAFSREVLSRAATDDTALRRLLLLEVSADLRERQRRLLHDAPPSAVQFEWRDTLPENFRGVVFANEILDALPAERFVVRGDEWWRLGVGLGAQGFEWRVRPADGACADDAAFSAEAALRRESLAAAATVLPDGYCGEWQPSLAAWLAALAATVERGVVLIADYGLPRSQLLHPDRLQGSLRCHYRHHAHGDPFLYPGLCDITTWVDFTTVGEAAQRCGFEVAGFATQAAFLLGAGIEREFAHASAGMDSADPRHVALARGLRQLMLPGEMGEAVKFMLLTRGLPREMFDDEPGFSLRDLRASL